MQNKQKERLVKSLYEKYPYPNRKLKNQKSLDNYVRWITKIINKKNEFWNKKEILELGCGTGELANGLSKNGAEVTAIDFSSNSIKIANEIKKRFKTNSNFLKKNILTLDLDKKFDVVIALGSLHHTTNPKKGFLIASKHCKKNGLIIIGLYNKYSRFRHRLRRIFIKIFCGNNIEKRIMFGKNIFGNMKSINWLADKYGQVHESYHSINEVLDWFKEENIKFITSKPPFKTPIIDEIKWLLKKESAFFVIVGKKSN